MRVVSRGEWGARPVDNYSSINPNAPTTLHWNGPATGLRTVEAERAFLRSVQRFHIEGRGWSDIAYNFAVGPSGSVYELRGRGVRSAANGTSTGNASSHAVFLMIGEGEEPTPGMVEAVKWLNDAVLEADGFVPHSHWKSTSCPGPVVKQMIESGVFDGGIDVNIEDRTRGIQASVNNALKETNRTYKGGYLKVDGVFGDETMRAVQEMANHLIVSSRALNVCRENVTNDGVVAALDRIVDAIKGS